MTGYRKHSVITTLLVSALGLLAAHILAGELREYRDVALVADDSNDGDSFRVRLGTDERTIRLYFVDCPETSVATETGARRVRSQTRYFGLPDHATTVAYGHQATDFVRKQLARPFVLYTSLASAPGRTSGGRVYGFVETADGKDLSTLLVQYGLARAYGVARKTPHGMHHAEMAARLDDMQSAAMLGRQGVWKDTDPELLISLRARERKEASEIRAIQESLLSPLGPVDINTASKARLQTIPGIGPTMAQALIDNRPYRTMDDIKGVPGVGAVTFKNLRSHLAEFGTE